MVDVKTAVSINTQTLIKRHAYLLLVIGNTSTSMPTGHVSNAASRRIQTQTVQNVFLIHVIL